MDVVHTGWIGRCGRIIVTAECQLVMGSLVCPSQSALLAWLTNVIDLPIGMKSRCV